MTAEEDLHVEGRNCRNTQDQEGLEEDSNSDGPPETVEDTQPSNSNFSTVFEGSKEQNQLQEGNEDEEVASSSEDEKRCAGVQTSPATEQVDPRDREMPALSDTQRIQETPTDSTRMASENRKSADQVLAPPSQGAPGERLGAFEENGGEPTRSVADFKQSRDQEGLVEDSNSDGPPETVEDTQTSTSNFSTVFEDSQEQNQLQEGNEDEEVASSSEDEKRCAGVQTSPATEQVDPRDRKRPALSDTQRIQETPTDSTRMASENRKSADQVLAPPSQGAPQERLGAFEENGGEPTRSVADFKQSREFEDDTEQQYESAPLVIIHATLVVENGSRITERQDSHSSEAREERQNNSDIDVEEGSESARRLDTRSDDGIGMVSGRHANVVVENVIMDEHMDEDLSEHRRTLEVVEATPLDTRKARCCQHRSILFGMCLMLFTIVIAAGAIVWHASDSDDDAQIVSPEVPPNDIDVGNTAGSFVRDVLPEYSRVALEDPTSPQSLALAWLWKETNATMALPSSRRVQRFTLATIFFALANPLYQESVELTGGWLSEQHECTWQTNIAPATACENGEFQALDMRQFELDGTLPPEIGLLTKLVSFDMSLNPLLVGTLPTELGYLSLMDQFRADDCALTGPIPTEIGLYTALRDYSLSNNQMSSSIPTELGRLTTLYRLELEFNMLTGPLPSEIGRMSGLHILLLHNNTLTGAIPTEFAALPNLLMVDVADNSMSGTLPTELGSLAEIVQILFHGNNFSGTIPKELGGLTKLDILMLQDTKLTGSVPSLVCKLHDSGDLISLTVDCTEVSCSCNCTCSNTTV